MMKIRVQRFDGDINFTTSNSLIIKGIKELPALDCESMSSDKIYNPQKKDYIQAIKNSFGNKVGSVTNIGSSLYDKQSLFDKDSKEYKELDKRIQIIQLIQQSCIDSAKQGKPPEPIPNYWFDEKCDSIKINKKKQEDGIYKILDNEEILKQKQYLLSICANKKPYYFKYIYNDSKVLYDNYRKEIDIMCMRQFRMTMEELINKENKTNEENNKLKYYLSKNPLSDNNCIVNKIAHIIENEFDKIIMNENKNKSFNYRLYMNKEVDEIDKNIIQKIKKVYKEYKMSNSNKQNSLSSNSDKEEGFKNNNQEINCLKDELLNINTNIFELTDILIHLAYKKDTLSKTFVWLMVGDVIIKNLLSKNNNKITYPVKDKHGQISFGGELFSERELVVDKEEI